MRKKMLIFGLGIVALLATSCMSQQSLTSNLNMNQTQVVLSQANYKIIGTARGEAKGASASKLVVNNAYAQMIKNANLTGSQALINVNYERITTLTNKQQVVVTGTIIEFVK